MLDLRKKKFNEEFCHFLNIIILVLFPALNFLTVIFKFNLTITLIYYLFALATLVILLMRYRYNSSSVYKKPIDRPLKLALIFLILFLAWAIVSTIFATDKKLALFDYVERGEGLFMYFAYALIFIGAFSVKNQSYKDKIIFAFQLFAIMVCVFNLLDFVSFQFGKKFCDWIFANPWTNPNHQGYFFAMAIPLSSVVMCFAKDKVNRILSIASFTLCNFTLCLNGSFGSELSVLVSLVLLIILGLKKDKSIWRMLLLALGIFVTTNALGYWVQVCALKDEPTVLQNYADFFSDLWNVICGLITGNAGDSGLASAGTGRWGLWYECLKNISAHPLVGIGINCQKVVNPSITASRPHNELLQFASTMGLPSIIFYMGALICIYIAFRKKLKTMSYGTFAIFFACFGYFVSSFFGVTLPYTFVYYIVFLGLLVSSLANEESSLQKDKKI